MKDGQNRDEEIYALYLKETINEFEAENALNEEGQKRIIMKGKHTARITTVMISLAVILLICPVLYLLSYMYYSQDSRADRLIDQAIKTIETTVPNSTVDRSKIDTDIGLFTLKTSFDVLSKIGGDVYKTRHYNIEFMMSSADVPKIEASYDMPLKPQDNFESTMLFHPKATSKTNLYSGWNTIRDLPDGTITEVYMSFSEILTQEQVEKMLPASLELRWLAVDTGIEGKQNDEEGFPVIPIGFPVQPDDHLWATYSGEEEHRAVFSNVLKELADSQKNVDTITDKRSQNQTLHLTERLRFIEKNGIGIYGAVVTGPTKDFAELRNNEQIEGIKIGEVKLWNYH
ncbi:anti-sigma factor [Bacillus sp. 1P06AnD]|uniref:anti-sigma factor n=1 Tax=Bacillus sp. 1P06AnD TaxID=3132208 RepID=UPI00399F4257